MYYCQKQVLLRRSTYHSVLCLPAKRIRNIVSLIPDEWLNTDSHFANAQENRDAYIQFLESRLKNSDLFVKEAQDARQSLI